MNGTPQVVFIQLGHYLVNYRRIGFVKFCKEAELNGKMPAPQLLIDFCSGAYGSTGESGQIDTAAMQFFGEEAAEIYAELLKVTH